MDSWRCGATGSQQRVCDDRHVLGGGIVWRRGGVDGRLGKVYASIHVLKMDRRKRWRRPLKRAHAVPAERPLDRFVSSPCSWAAWLRPPDLDIRRWCEFWTGDPDHVHLLHQTSRSCDKCCEEEVDLKLIDVLRWQTSLNN